MKKYTFQMTKKEVRELCFRMLWEFLLLNPFKGLLMLVIFVLEGIVLWEIVPFAIVLAPLSIAAVLQGIYSGLVKQICGKTRSVWTEDGMLKSDREGELTIEIPCDSITEFRTSSHLLMLGRYQSPKVIGWHPVPLRVFADEKERDEFVESVRNPQEQTQEKTSVLGGEKYFSISFQVGEEEGVRMMADATEILQAGTLEEKKKGRFVGVILAAIFVVFSCWAVWLWEVWLIPDVWIACIMPFAGMLFFLMQLRKLLESPEKKIRSQIRRGNVMNLIWGNWEISVTETGILQNMSGESNTMMPWESLLCMVEMDTGLFFFQKDKKHFMMLPKQGLESREQIESLKELCREKQVEIIVGKRKKYVPNGLFPILTFMVVMGYLLANAWLAFRDSQEDISYGYIPYDNITYNYVPFEEQISVLRSLGFSISEGLEESWRGYMEDEETVVYIEEYPYTDLLIALSWVGGGGEDSAKVFWFDFEGWDISKDYIRVLEGMRELASGSALDDVRNIREDIENMDWEKGTGTITVSLEWKGQEYSWEMDVENDWIDGKVQGIYNSLLEKTEISERFYTTWDGGQGALVFYCTGEWALEFEKATGMEMEAY